MDWEDQPFVFTVVNPWNRVSNTCYLSIFVFCFFVFCYSTDVAKIVFLPLFQRYIIQDPKILESILEFSLKKEGNVEKPKILYLKKQRRSLSFMLMLRRKFCSCVFKCSLPLGIVFEWWLPTCDIFFFFCALSQDQVFELLQN